MPVDGSQQGSSQRVGLHIAMGRARQGIPPPLQAYFSGHRLGDQTTNARQFRQIGKQRHEGRSLIGGRELKGGVPIEVMIAQMRGDMRIIVGRSRLISDHGTDTFGLPLM